MWLLLQSSTHLLGKLLMTSQAEERLRTEQQTELSLGLDFRRSKLEQRNTVIPLTQRVCNIYSCFSGKHLDLNENDEKAAIWRFLNMNLFLGFHWIQPGSSGFIRFHSCLRFIKHNQASSSRRLHTDVQPSQVHFIYWLVTSVWGNLQVLMVSEGTSN